MARTSHSNVMGLFQHLVKALGGHMAKAHNDVGGWRMDYQPEYGGYTIERISGPGGGVSQPFGSGRHKAGEMWQMMRFALIALEMPRGARSGDKRSSRSSRGGRRSR
jgi:hypothetical protein